MEMDIDAIKYAVIRLDSGEIVKLTNKIEENGAALDKFVETLEDIERKQKYYDVNKQFTDFQLFQKSYLGTYIQNYFNRFLKLNVSPQYMLRFLYLCTFAEFDTNILKIGATRNRRKMTMKDLEEILNLSSKEFYNTKNLLIDKNLIKVELDSIIVNPKIVLRGEIKIRKGVHFVKIYDEAIEELYKKASAKEHKKLGYLIELLPFLNVYHNIICTKETVETISIDEVNPLDFKEICDILNYNKNQSSRLQRELLNIEVNEELAVIIVQHKTLKFVTINPRIFYRGNNIEDLKALSNLFRVRKKNN